MTILVVAYPGSSSRPAGRFQFQFNFSSSSTEQFEDKCTMYTLSMSLLTDIFAQEEKIELELNPASGRCHHLAGILSLSN